MNASDDHTVCRRRRDDRPEPGNSPDERFRAARAVARHARSAAEYQQLLDMLGLAQQWDVVREHRHVPVPLTRRAG